MKIKKVLRLLDVIENLPSDIRHMLYEEDTSMDMDGAYYSDSQNRYIPVGEMDIVHVLRSFKKYSLLRERRLVRKLRLRQKGVA